MIKIEKGAISPTNGYILSKKEYEEYIRDKKVLDALEEIVGDNT